MAPRQGVSRLYALKQSLKRHAIIVGIAVLFGGLAYGAIHILIWVLRAAGATV